MNVVHANLMFHGAAEDKLAFHFSGYVMTSSLCFKRLLSLSSCLVSVSANLLCMSELQDQTNTSKQSRTVTDCKIQSVDSNLSFLTFRFSQE